MVTDPQILNISDIFFLCKKPYYQSCQCCVGILTAICSGCGLGFCCPCFGCKRPDCASVCVSGWLMMLTAPCIYGIVVGCIIGIEMCCVYPLKYFVHIFKILHSNSSSQIKDEDIQLSGVDNTPSSISFSTVITEKTHTRTQSNVNINEINKLIQKGPKDQKQSSKITVNFETSNNQAQKRSKSSNKISTTKYNVATFLPIFLIEQYSKIQNIYVLVIAILNLLPMNQTVSVATTFFPIISVLIITGIRELYEDISRAVQDKQINDKQYQLFFSKTNIKSKNINQGDIILVKQGQICPVDGVILGYNEQDDYFVSTAAIDGDIDFKKKKCIEISQGYDIKQDAVIYAQPPTISYEVFNGTFIEQIQRNDIFEPARTSYFSINNAVLKGSKMQQDTQLVAVYTGKNTKQILSTKTKKVKKSSALQLQLNKITIFVTLLSILAVICSICIGCFTLDEQNGIQFENEPKTVKDVILRRFLQSVVVVQYFMPLSLLVSLELSRVCQSLMCTYNVKNRSKKNRKDIKSVYEANVLIRDSTTMDNVCQCKYALIDKTGTLTKNKLSFAGQIDKKGNQHKTLPPKYLLEAALVNSSVCDIKTDVQQSNNSFSHRYDLQAQNPDDYAIAKHCLKQNCYVTQRDSGRITVTQNDQYYYYKIIFEIPYKSDCQFQCIVCQQCDEKYFKPKDNNCMIFIKGSEQAIQLYGDVYCQEMTNIQVELKKNQFNEQQRCIYYIHKNISESTAQKIFYQYRMIKDLDDQSVEKQLFFKELYTHAQISQCIMLKDLVREQAGNVIEQLKKQNINIFIVSGDTTNSVIDTANQIGIDTEHVDKLTQDMENPLISQFEKLYQERVNVQKKWCLTQNNIQLPLNTIIMDSFTIHQLTKTKQQQKQFSQLISTYKCGLFVKLFPEDKAQLVKLLKIQDSSRQIMAIGDAQNDILNIKQADVGIGVVGVEGTQACQQCQISLPDISFLPSVIEQSQSACFRNSYAMKS